MPYEHSNVNGHTYANQPINNTCIRHAPVPVDPFHILHMTEAAQDASTDPDNGQTGLWHHSHPGYLRVNLTKSLYNMGEGGEGISKSPADGKAFHTIHILHSEQELYASAAEVPKERDITTVQNV